MNNQRRKELEKAIGFIEEAKEIIENIQSEEQDSFDNLSEGVQQSERGQKMEEAANTLEQAVGNLEEALDNVNTASE